MTPTPSRLEVYEAICAHFDTHGTAPSMRELVAAGLASSTSHARAHCRALVKAGLLHAGGRGEARRFVPAWAVGVRAENEALRRLLCDLAAAVRRERAWQRAPITMPDYPAGDGVARAWNATADVDALLRIVESLKSEIA